MGHYCYKMTPCRPSLPFDATPEESAIIGRHFNYIKEYFDAGTVLFVGRCEGGEFGITVFQAAADDEAEAMMRDDPAVRTGVMSATLYPLRVVLMHGTAA